MRSTSVVKTAKDMEQAELTVPKTTLSANIDYRNIAPSAQQDVGQCGAAEVHGVVDHNVDKLRKENDGQSHLTSFYNYNHYMNNFSNFEIFYKPRLIKIILIRCYKS